MAIRSQGGLEAAGARVPAKGGRKAIRLAAKQSRARLTVEVARAEFAGETVGTSHDRSSFYIRTERPEGCHHAGGAGPSLPADPLQYRQRRSAHRRLPQAEPKRPRAGPRGRRAGRRRCGADHGVGVGGLSSIPRRENRQVPARRMQRSATPRCNGWLGRSPAWDRLMGRRLTSPATRRSPSIPMRASASAWKASA